MKNVIEQIGKGQKEKISQLYKTTDTDKNCLVKLCFVSEEANKLYKDTPADFKEPCGLSYGSKLAAGRDLRACLDKGEIYIGVGERLEIPTGIKIAPCMDNVAGFIYSRSGLGAKQGLTVAQGVGLIDPDYSGEIKVYLLNTSQDIQKIARGSRIAQLVFKTFCRPQFEEVDFLDITERGDKGFGSSGLK